jgi:hypothetical protein
MQLREPWRSGGDFYLLTSLGLDSYQDKNHFYQSLIWRATVDEDGQYSFAITL